MILFSIIIPVHNAEKYLSKCLDSALSQTYPLIEVIALNDASTDSSALIIDVYQHGDDRVRAVHFPYNIGNGKARNHGLKIASGDYILFLDADDFLEIHAVEKINEQLMAQKTDILMFGYKEHIINKRKTTLYLPAFDLPDDQDHLIRYLLLQNKGMFWQAWVYCIGRSFIEKNKITFNENGYFYEDMTFTLKLFSVAFTIQCIREPFYNYLRHLESATNTVSNHSLTSKFLVVQQIRKQLRDNEQYERFKNEFTVLFSLIGIISPTLDYVHLKKSQISRELQEFITAIWRSEEVKQINLMKLTLPSDKYRNKGMPTYRETQRMLILIVYATRLFIFVHRVKVYIARAAFQLAS